MNISDQERWAAIYGASIAMQYHRCLADGMGISDADMLSFVRQARIVADLEAKIVEKEAFDRIERIAKGETP